MGFNKERIPMNTILDVAIQSARSAGEVIVEAIQHIETIKFQEKAPFDFVSEIDRQSETIIMQMIRQHYPDHAILSEESGSSTHNPSSDYLWIIDPLDGTTNFLHAVPHCAISIGIQYQNHLQYAVVYDPIRRELFTATQGQGAKLNDKVIQVSQQPQLKGSLLGTGYPYRNMDYLEPYIATFKTLIPETVGIRRCGSAALDLAYIACGRFDGFWEFQLKSWDIAAGILLVQEAGGSVVNIKGLSANCLEDADIIAGNPTVAKELLTVVQRYNLNKK